MCVCVTDRQTDRQTEKERERGEGGREGGRERERERERERGRERTVLISQFGVYCSTQEEGEVYRGRMKFDTNSLEVVNNICGDAFLPTRKLQAISCCVGGCCYRFLLFVCFLLSLFDFGSLWVFF